MKKTWKPIVAGIMGIIVGIFQVPFIWFFQGIHELEVGPLDMKAWLAIVVLALLAIFAIVGGIYHIFRTNWPLAMTGAIAASALLPIFIGISIEYGAILGGKSLIYAYPYTSPGIAATVLTALSKKEFKK
jgi:hypothetical protein